jgi:hypothetical protein
VLTPRSDVGFIGGGRVSFLISWKKEELGGWSWIARILESKMGLEKLKLDVVFVGEPRGCDVSMRRVHV